MMLQSTIRAPSEMDQGPDEAGAKPVKTQSHPGLHPKRLDALDSPDVAEAEIDQLPKRGANAGQIVPSMVWVVLSQDREPAWFALVVCAIHSPSEPFRLRTELMNDTIVVPS